MFTTHKYRYPAFLMSTSLRQQIPVKICQFASNLPELARRRPGKCTKTQGVVQTVLTSTGTRTIIISTVTVLPSAPFNESWSIMSQLSYQDSFPPELQHTHTFLKLTRRFKVMLQHVRMSLLVVEVLDAPLFTPKLQICPYSSTSTFETFI
jgi:hypothetical protein